MNLFKTTLGILFTLVIVSESKAVEKYSNSCEDVLGEQLIEEIKAYENVKNQILEYVIEGDFKGKTYDE